MAQSTGSQTFTPHLPKLHDRAENFLRPTEFLWPDEWGANNRVYPESAGLPGRRDPWLTPYMIPLGRKAA